jgi:hypothetical protein
VEMSKGTKSDFYYAVAAIPFLGDAIVGPDIFHVAEETKRLVCLAT